MKHDSTSFHYMSNKDRSERKKMFLLASNRIENEILHRPKCVLKGEAYDNMLIIKCNGNHSFGGSG